MPNSPINVLITLPFSSSLVTRLEEISPRLRITVQAAKKIEDLPEGILNHCEVLYTSHLLPTPEQTPGLRWIQFHSSGIDHAIKAPILQKTDLIATTNSGATSSQAAEYVLAMLLTLGHRIPALIKNQEKKEWPSDRWERFSPTELRDSTVGLVGYGAINRQVAYLLRNFGATVLAVKRNAMQPVHRGYTPEGLGDPEGDLVHRLYPIQAIKSMLKECDFVVVAVPLSQNTRDLINADVLAAMRPNAYLVDVSRGYVIDHKALIKALQERKIAGAALDVFSEEPLPAADPLWKMPNVILTPHIAGISKHFDERTVTLFAENLDRYINNQPLLNQFNHQQGY
ncbi:MAG: D-2-hydroxyacid dehydrogenase [Anaerolineales bacterium]|nr:D-2-hydroxyacid dehydrogenase [Anaerolineales bacterium]